MKNKSTLIVSFISIAVFCFIFFLLFKSDKSEYDVIDKENSKMIEMTNVQIERALKDHTQSGMYPGYILESRANSEKYLSSIKSIEKYARYGVLSRKARNTVYLKIVFNNGTVVNEVYTGETTNGLLGASLLVRVHLKDGKTIKVETNGIEKKGSPDWITNDLYNLIDDAISYDITRNPTRYFPPDKTSKDFGKEWEDL